MSWQWHVHVRSSDRVVMQLSRSALADPAPAGQTYVRLPMEAVETGQPGDVLVMSADRQRVAVDHAASARKTRSAELVRVQTDARARTESVASINAAIAVAATDADRQALQELLAATTATRTAGLL